ncbi:MAG: ATP-grasp domain-containing protein [Proteobacteria bacterium]|nr:ATP-grasp domain-containing protein [Pseudomonadota bacterium]
MPNNKIKATVLLGDPKLPDPVKKDGVFNPEDIETINALKKTLSLLENFEFTYLDNHQTFLETLSLQKPQLVLNFCDEGFNNQATKELHIPALLELLDIPYTGAGPTCLATCYNKATVRLIADSLQVPVPLEFYLSPNDPLPSSASFPVLIKPNFGDGSFGITQSSVVYHQAQFIEQLELMRKQFPHTPLLIQEYLEGPEYTVGLIGNPGNFEALPLIEIDFSKLNDNLPKILSYESKWVTDSPYWNNIIFKEAQLSDKNKEKLIAYAKQLFERMECRDYARFDFRANKNGEIKLLEVNPNPGLNWLTLADYADEILLDKILTFACKRLGLFI